MKKSKMKEIPCKEYKNLRNSNGIEKPNVRIGIGKRKMSNSIGIEMLKMSLSIGIGKRNKTPTKVDIFN